MTGKEHLNYDTFEATVEEVKNLSRTWRKSREVQNAYGGQAYWKTAYRASIRPAAKQGKAS